MSTAGATTTSTGSTGDSTTEASGSTGTNATSPSSPTSTVSLTDSSSDSSPDDSSFCARPEEHEARCSPSDFGPSHRCDPWAQDCPAGDKCNPYSYDGDNQWESLKCVPLDPNPDPIGAACTVEGSPASGIDSCVVGAMCWGVDLMTFEGTCVGFCTGSPDDPICPPDTTCSITHDNVLILCLPTCDPLVPDCPDGDVCVFNPDDPAAFMCVYDGSGVAGQLFDPCEYLNACDPGLTCQDSELALECDPRALGCCLPFCDTTAPNTCPGVMQECHPWFEMGMAPPDLEHLGVCSLPA